MTKEKQYCRYCTFLTIGKHGTHCMKQNREIKDVTAKAKNACKDYEHTPYDAFTGNMSRKDKRMSSVDSQIDLFADAKG